MDTVRDIDRAAMKRAEDLIFGILQESEKQKLIEEKENQLEDAKKEITRERYRRKKDVEPVEVPRESVPDVRLKLPKIEYTRESAVKLLDHKAMVEHILESLTAEIATSEPLTEGDFTRGQNRLTARLSMSKMPYLQTKRERKLINGLKADWSHRRSAAEGQAQDIVQSAPKEILESEDLEVEFDEFLKTGIWREHEDKDQETVNDEILDQGSAEENDREYFAPDDSEGEPPKKEETPLDRAKRQNRNNLSTYYKEWTQAHRDLQMIRIAMELCSPDARAYAEQMLFRKGKATHLVDAEQRGMPFLRGRECYEEAVTAMLYVIGLQEKAVSLNTHSQPEPIEIVRINSGGHEKVVPLTFEVIKQIAAGEVILRPDYPWYESIPVDGYGYEVEERLLEEFLGVETGETKWDKRSPDIRPLAAVKEYQQYVMKKAPSAIDRLYANSKAMGSAISVSADIVKTEQCYTIPSEILVTGVSELLKRVCSLQAAVITRFEQEVEDLPEKHRMVLRQLYIEGRRFRELTTADGKPLSKNSSSRWNKEGLEMIQERMADKPL